jgi:L-methionine (R)-S-oxide reductase
VFVLQIVKTVANELKIEWLGIYKIYDDVWDNNSSGLVKEAYQGEESRPIFPLTAAYAAKSNNSWVAMNGKARVIQDTRSADVPYYECSRKVRSEACLPIFNVAGQVVGIIDAESWTKDYFVADIVSKLEKMCTYIGLHQLV